MFSVGSLLTWLNILSPTSNLDGASRKIQLDSIVIAATQGSPYFEFTHKTYDVDNLCFIKLDKWCR